MKPSNWNQLSVYLFWWSLLRIWEEWKYFTYQSYLGWSKWM